MPHSLPVVRVTQIGEYIRHHSCERRFKLDHGGRELTKQLPFFFTLSSAMDPVLAEAGRRREHDWEEHLRADGLADLCRYEERPGVDFTPWETFALRCASLTPGQQAYGREIEVTGDVGGFHVAGRIDFALVRWDGERPTLRLVECKASRKDRTYQRVQLALYRVLVQGLLQNGPLLPGGRAFGPRDIECVVARIDETTNTIQDMRTLPPLDLDMEEADARLLLAADGPLTEILARPIGELEFQLDTKCDDCAMNVYCLPEAARGRRIELLGIEAGTVRALRAAGVGGLDALADLTSDGPAATQVRADPGFGADLNVLVAKARARRGTLPGEKTQTKEPQVSPLPHAGNGQLPPHITGAQRLVRVFVSVHYDYVENRVGAISAHVTRSDQPLSTLFVQHEGRWRPDPDVKEQWATGKDAEDKTLFADRPLMGEDIVGVLPRPWSGDYETDTRREADMLGGFFKRVVEAIQSFTPEGRAPVHFYVWSRNEITRLVEACARADTDLLSSLRELLGCRESLEQLMYSCLGDEIDSRYALGWTGRSLGVAVSLPWFGRRFHWTRQVGSEDVALDRAFRQGIFDFKTTLKFDRQGQWRPLDDAEAQRHQFEVRACFQDALPAPYWRAHWGTLPDPDAPGLDAKLRAGIVSYQEAGKPGYLKAYLKARGQALRWIEESVKFKNTEIAKPPVDVQKLPTFTLGVASAARSALDFLWLEQHVATNDWMAARMVPPAGRVASGRTLPVRDVKPTSDNKLSATIDLDGYPLDSGALESRCGLAAGAFVRLSPCADDAQKGQTVAQIVRGGSTCILDAIDWETGHVALSVMPFTGRENRYILPSRSWPAGSAGYGRGTLDESLSDFVAGKIDARLQSDLGAHVYRWFDPQDAQIPPQTPLSANVIDRYRALLSQLDLGSGPLAPDQAAAVIDGLGARVQLLQGPPGTGKTQTTAAAALLRILARRDTGDVVLVAANTHTAVDTLLRRMAALGPRFEAGAAGAGFALPPVRLAKAHSSQPDTATGEDIEDFTTGSGAGFVAVKRLDSVLVVGGTPNALLKLAKELGRSAPFSHDPQGFQAPMLIVDEASMMVLPHFLAVASLVREDGEILLAGDHRQLAPIMAHDWEREDRPPVVLYQPYVSAYEAVRSLKRSRSVPDAAIRQSALEYTFRLPPAIRTLIARLYRLDGIELAGPPDPPSPARGSAASTIWEKLWQAPTGLYLVTHDERASRQSNPTEAAIIAEILRAAGPLGDGTVGIVVPHRAQRTLLKTELGGFAAVDVVDTVERFQGGERQTIIVSATASDPAAISARAEFLLGLNRANVAFSRAQRRLIVICSERLIAHIPPSTEHYAEALLWKSLRAVCPRPLGETQTMGHSVRVWTVEQPAPENPRALISD